ncbi:hypothetical protein K4F52_010359, partial [Lecanicillium sp. MT-2017a]
MDPTPNRPEQAKILCPHIAENHAKDGSIVELVYVGRNYRPSQVMGPRVKGTEKDKLRWEVKKWPEVKLPGGYGSKNGNFFQDWRRFCVCVEDPSLQAWALMNGVEHVVCTTLEEVGEEKGLRTDDEKRDLIDLVELFDQLSSERKADVSSSAETNARPSDTSCPTRDRFETCAPEMPDKLAEQSVVERVYVGLSMQLKEVKSA